MKEWSNNFTGYSVTDNNPANPLFAVHGTLEKLPTLNLDSTFTFRCHKGIACWGECCHNPDLFLTPYDVLRLKRARGMTSQNFLARHTVHYLGEDFGLPVVKLKCDGPRNACPFFAGAEGCAVYAGRPTSCRAYPVGQAASSGSSTANSATVLFKIEEDHCLGWREKDEWTPVTWFENEGVLHYNDYNEFAIRLAFHPRLGAPGALDERKMGMLFMALYDLDRFREFVLSTSFLDKFAVDEGELEAIRAKDEALLHFAARWINHSILGVKSFDVKTAR